MECPQKAGDGGDLMIAYAARRLCPTDEAALEHHLEMCPSCRELAATQRVVWSALDELTPLPVSSNFDAKLYQRIVDDRQDAWWQRLFQVHWSWRPAMPVVAASGILIVAFMVKNLQPSITSAPQPPPKFQIEQVERALDDMDMLKQAGVEFALENPTPREQI
jgi:hypothetical protein